MAESGFSAALEGLAIEAVEWLPSGADAGLVRVRARWADAGRRADALPALGLRRGEEARRFQSLPDARFGRDPAVWRGTYLVPAALMDPAPDELWLSWEGGARASLPAVEKGFEPPVTDVPLATPPEPGGEVIDRAVLAERRARRAEEAERTQAQRAAEALKALEVLELRSAELERRLEALQAAPEPPPLTGVLLEAESNELAGAAAPAPEPTLPSSLLPARPREDALATAIATVKRLRSDVDAQRRRVRRSELLRAADSVALAALRHEEGIARGLEQQLAVAEERAARALAALEQAAEQVALARRRAAADATAVRTRAAGELAAARETAERELAAERDRAATAQAAADQAQTALEVAGRDLTAERTAHAETRERLAAREAELAAIAGELRGVREALDRVHHDATERAGDLERRLAGLEAELAAERRAHAGAATELETAHAGLALAQAASRAESVARAALDEQLDRERLARTTLAETLDAARAETARARGAEAALRSELAAARVRIAELAGERERGQSKLLSVQSESGGLLARIAELERAVDSDLERRGSEQSAAAAAVRRSPGDDGQALSADLDAAAAGLRARIAEPVPAKAEPAAANSEPAVAAASPPPQPRLLSGADRPERADVIGSSRRVYPWLRGALVKLAHDDPAAATRLLLALVPAQRVLLPSPLEYDVTITGSGTYAISVGRHGAAARPIGAPRPRSGAAFHVSADIVTLTELLAGVEKRMGRWLGSVKVRGRRRVAFALRDTLRSARLDLPAAARAGADLGPDLVLPTFAYAIHPSWTKGHAFTVIHEITGPRPMRWHVTIRDGRPVTVERRPSVQPPDAVVTMSRAAFSRLLAGEPAPSGERPAIRGDRAAVATLKAWTDRAQGHPGGVSRSVRAHPGDGPGAVRSGI